MLKNIRISAKKLARFAKLVSGMHVVDALAQCSVARETKAAGLLRGVIASAAANARANHGNLRGGCSETDDGDDDSFRVAAAVVGRAPTPTRPWYHGKGRTGVRHLYRSHLTVRSSKKIFFSFLHFDIFSLFFLHSPFPVLLGTKRKQKRNQIELEATSKPPLTRYQKPLLERQGKGRLPKRSEARTSGSSSSRSSEREQVAAEVA